MRAPFAAQDLRDLHDGVFAITVTGIQDYASDLLAAGFIDITATDQTADWAPFTTARLAAWQADRASYARAHGEGAYAAQEKFYAVVARLFASGNLGGIRLVAHVA